MLQAGRVCGMGVLSQYWNQTEAMVLHFSQIKGVLNQTWIMTEYYAY